MSGIPTKRQASSRAQGAPAPVSLEEPGTARIMRAGAAAEERASGATLDWEAFYQNFRKPGFIPGYEIQNRLGGGAFGDVYKARKLTIGKAYAIKFLKVEDQAHQAGIERELESVRHFAAIDHPNLVTIEDLGTVLDGAVRR